MEFRCRNCSISRERVRGIQGAGLPEPGSRTLRWRNFSGVVQTIENQCLGIPPVSDDGCSAGPSEGFSTFPWARGSDRLQCSNLLR